MFDKNLLSEIREITGSGIVDCKNALIEAKNDKELAIEILRKKGMMSAKNKSTRTTSEGAIFVKKDKQNIYICKIECETDFVAKSDKFIQLGRNMLDLLSSVNANSIEGFFGNKNSKNETFEDIFNMEKASLGENIVISNIKSLSLKDNEEGTVYLHNKVSDDSAKLISVIISSKLENDDCVDFLKKIAMHVAASDPISLSIESLSDDVKQKEMSIYEEQIKQSGKAGPMVSKIAEGMMRKFYENNCLLEQFFVVDNKKKVKEAIEDFNKQEKQDIKIFSFFKIN